MAKGTVIFLFILTIIATLLLGINIGKKIGISQSTMGNQQLIITPSPTIKITPTILATPSATMKKSTGTTTYTDRRCGFSFSYPGSFIKEKSVNGQATILADPEDPNATIVATCDKSLPRPPVTSDKIESITLDKFAATLYHDQNQDGTPRDEVIVKHPTSSMEIILAGYGDIFQKILTSFQFVY
ncbi:hypothetical protein HY029_05015 [Candidatus Gottesmanbacteria bacterium]|nr:hypothetical protein [Candidatus Gottesmanbacteria bacterium]